MSRTGAAEGQENDVSTAIHAPSAVSPACEQRRLPELDALRGLAAFSVVLFHYQEMWLPATHPAAGFAHKLVNLALLPFHAGPEAVTMFFVLSGMVLALPYLRGRGQAYPQFLLRRVVRIYGPYLGALALALLADARWHNHPDIGPWLRDTWSRPLAPGPILAHVALIGVFSTQQYLFVVWSLVQEMRISAVLPWLVRSVQSLSAGAKMSAALLLSSLSVVAIGASPETSARYNLLITGHYAAMFILGILLAAHRDLLQRIWQRTPRELAYAVSVLSALLYLFDQRLAAVVLAHVPGPLHTHAMQTALRNWSAGIGACGVIVLSLHAVPLQKLLRTRVAQWLGLISFSLYLVHPTVLLSVRFAAGDRLSARAQFLPYVLGSLLVAWLFCMVVEERCIRLSRRVGMARLPLPLADAEVSIS